MNKSTYQRLLLTLDDPMSADVGDKELTKMPLLPGDRIYRMEIRKPSVKPSSKDANVNVLTVPFHTTTEAVDQRTGDKINPGFPVFHRITITPTDKVTPHDIAKRVGQVCQACGISGVSVKTLLDNPEQYLDGKIVDVKIGIQPAKDGFDESNQVKSFPKAA